MGIVADTSVFTLCERKRWTAVEAGRYLAGLFPGEQIIIPAVAAAELVSGIYRAVTPGQFAAREAYVRDLLRAYVVAPFTQQTAWLSGRIRGEEAQLGNTLPLGDSLIAACAMELNCRVLTHNVKDFVRVPGLNVIAFSLP